MDRGTQSEKYTEIRERKAWDWKTTRWWGGRVNCNKSQYYAHMHTIMMRRVGKEKEHLLHLNKILKEAEKPKRKINS